MAIFLYLYKDHLYKIQINTIKLQTKSILSGNYIRSNTYMIPLTRSTDTIATTDTILSSTSFILLCIITMFRSAISECYLYASNPCRNLT